MQKRWIWLALLLVALFAFNGCSDDDDPVVVVDEDTAFEVLAAAGAAYINSTDCPGVAGNGTGVGQVDLDGNPLNYTIIDIRSKDDYSEGHIPGSYNSSLVTLIADPAKMPTDKPYVVVCKSGQSAGHAKIAMELMGPPYDDVKSLAWGMCSWGTETNGSWESTTNTGDFALGTEETTNENSNLVSNSFPTDVDDNYMPASVVAERISDTLAEGFKAMSYAAYMADADHDEIFVINYFGETDYMGEDSEGVAAPSGVPGDLPGAFQFTPNGSLGIDQMLENVDPGNKVLVYCWTGQHSSQITFYLNMLGYDAYSLLFGSNALWQSELIAHVWETPTYPNPEREMVEWTTPWAVYGELVEELSTYFNGSGWYIKADVLHDAMAAAELAEEDPPYTIVDVRGSGDFDLGHIKGAINVSVAELPGQIADGTIPTNMPFVVTCYTGQSAGYASAYLNLMGYTSMSLKFGMSSWNTGLAGKWDTAANLSPQVTPVATAENDNLDWHIYPELDGADVETLLADRLASVMAEGLKGYLYTNAANNTVQVQGYEDDFFIVNYWNNTDYTDIGHIDGAFQFTPANSLTCEDMLSNLPHSPIVNPGAEDDKILVYCWTGQTSSQITMYLRLLGYDAYSLYYGANTLFRTSLPESSRWTLGGIWDYELFVHDIDGIDVPAT